MRTLLLTALLAAALLACAPQGPVDAGPRIDDGCVAPADAAVGDSAASDATVASPDATLRADAMAAGDAAQADATAPGEDASVATEDAGVARDASATEDALRPLPAPACALAVDRVTLRAVNQARNLSLPGEGVLTAESSAAPVLVAASAGAAHVVAQSSGDANVILHGVVQSGVVEVNVDLTDSPFAVRVVATSYGINSGFGQDKFPGVVLGPPKGNGARASSLDVLTLGVNGSITVELGVDIVDGPGADFIVFENAFNEYFEAGRVEVSADGTTFVAFACENLAPYTGCAGLGAVLSNPTNGVDPTDPATAGGDSFDLADIGVHRARYVRVTDVSGFNMGGTTAGFDLDAVAVVNAVPVGSALAGPAEVSVGVGTNQMPRFDLAVDARPIYGVAVECSVEPAGVVEVGCRCALTGLQAGEAQLTATLGDMQIVIPVHVAH